MASVFFCLRSLAFGAALATSGHLWAQTASAELPVAPPLTFDLAQAEPFEVGGQNRLQYAVIPDTLSIEADGIVRYVMVVTSGSGAQNVVFDALRCTSDESKTLARWSPSQKQWIANERSAWSDVNDLKNRATLVSARGVLCLNRLNLGSRDEMLRELQRQ